MRLGQEALAGLTGVTSTGYCVAKVTFFSPYFGMAATLTVFPVTTIRLPAGRNRQASALL